MEGRSYYLNKIIDNLSWLYCQLDDAGRLNLQDRKVRAENIMCGLLNRIHGWSLENANMLSSNFPGVDLVDTTARVAVQVTSTNSLKKVENTWEKFDTEEMRSTYKKLYILVMKKDAPTKQMREYVRGSWFDGSKDIWNFTTLGKQIEDIERVETLMEISRYLQEQVGVINKVHYRLPPVPTASESFVPGSRDEELRDIKKRFDENADSRNPVYLCGMGGIGKTEVAIQFAKKHAPPEGAFFLHYIQSDDGDSMRKTILQASIEGYRFRGEDDDDRQSEYEDRLRILRDCFHGAMVVLDNWDGQDVNAMRKEKAFQDLLACGLRLVITTRFQMARGVEIKPMGEKLLLRLMRSIYDAEEELVEDELLLELIRAVDSHTLTVDLMAKTLFEMWDENPAAMMLEALKNSELNSEDFPEVVQEKNHLYEQKRLYAHLSTLFSFSGMMQNRDECNIMRYATLLPGGGMQDRLFEDCLSREQRQPLRKLIDRGWIQHKCRLLTMHPVIREVCREELKPNDDNCRPFLEELHNRRRQGTAQRKEQTAVCFSIAAKRLPDRQGDWAYYASECWSGMGQRGMQCEYALRSVKKREQVLQKSDKAGIQNNKRRLAAAYNMVSEAYSHSSAHEKALPFCRKALELRLESYGKYHEKVAASYNNLGMIHCHLDNRDEAMDYLLKALRIRKGSKYPNKAEIAKSYNNIGTEYFTRSDYKNALKFRMMSLELRREIYADQPDHPELAGSLNNVGRTYRKMGRYEEALELLTQALEIRKKVLYTSDSDLANSYYNVGDTLAAMERYDDAISHMEMAVGIWESLELYENKALISTKQELEALRAQAADPV